MAPQVKKGGFTLLEVVVAMGLWMIFMTGVSQLIDHSTRAVGIMTARQEAIENARVALDALMINIQMANEVELRLDNDGMLRTLILRQMVSSPPFDRYESFRFTYNSSLPSTHVLYNRLNLGVSNELASNLSEVRLTLSADRDLLHITITTCESLGQPITLTSTVDIRYKKLIL